METVSLHGSRSAGPTMSLLDSNRNQGNIGVGNYKGVMLCNRPFAGAAGGLNGRLSFLELIAYIFNL